MIRIVFVLLSFVNFFFLLLAYLFLCVVYSCLFYFFSSLLSIYQINFIWKMKIMKGKKK